MSLVEMVAEKAQTLGAVRVEAVHVRLGTLSGVVKDALLFAFDSAAKGTTIEGARLEIVEVPLTVRCPTCAEERELPTLQLRCPVCARPTPEVVHGRELELAFLEVHENAAADR
jgi:hydrogenase nickel incorporation protein HypA/HybF